MRVNRIIGNLSWPVAALLLSAGCAPDFSPTAGRHDDLALARPDLHLKDVDDLATETLDAARLPDTVDLSVPADLTTPPSDGAAAGPHLSNLPSCSSIKLTAQQVFTDVIKPRCNVDSCHGDANGAGDLKSFSDAAHFRAATVHVASLQAHGLDVISAGDPDHSYLLYKVMGQQLAAKGYGKQMPLGKTRLTDAEICKLLIWIHDGAP